MAAGGCNVSRKRYFHHSKVENHRRANGYRDKSLKTCRDRLFVDLSLLSSRNLDGGNDGHRQREGFVDRYFNKDHVDLHVPRDSIEASDLESQARVSGVTKLADATGDKNKRKFSPILWDRDDKEVRISSRIKVVRRSSPSSSPIVPQSAFALPITRCPVTAQIQDLQDLTADPHVANGSFETDISKAARDLVATLSSEPYGSNFPEHENVEEQYVEERSISTSKWANVDTSPMSPCTSGSSPESGEFYREGFEETKKKSGSAKAYGFAEPASEDDHSVNGLEDYDYMEIDEKCQKVDDDEVPKHKGINMLEGCRSVFKYEKLNKINEGTYGVVYRAKDKETREIVALKKVKMAAETEGFPVTSLREINILMSIHHQSVVAVKEVVMDELDGVFMVMEYMEHDLKGLLEVMKQPFSQSEVKCLMLQLLEGVKALHDNWVLHRDLKTSNLLLNNRGELKICDFGMSRQYGSPLKPYTSLVVTLWYRAPEILLGAKQYSTAIDMWSVGCIMAELLAKEPLFSGKTELDQLDKIFKTLGTPSEMIWPGFSNLPEAKASFVKQPYNMLRKKFPAATFTGSPALTELGFDLLNKLLTYDPNERITAEEALNHGWFKEVPLPKSKDFMPTFPAQVTKRCKPIIHRKRA